MGKKKVNKLLQAIRDRTGQTMKKRATCSPENMLNMHLIIFEYTQKTCMLSYSIHLLFWLLSLSVHEYIKNPLFQLLAR